MDKFVVIVGAVTVTTGKKPNGRPQVARLTRGTILNAPAEDSRVLDLLSMKAVTPVETLASDMGALRKLGTPRQPTVVKGEDGSYRLTARGLATTFNLPTDPAILPADDDEVLPVPAPASGIQQG